jgi:hypothetical protein
MNRRSITLAALVLLAVVSPADAAVLGRRHIGVGIGVTWIDDATIDRASLDFSARLRLPVSRRFDVVAFHGQAMLEGPDNTVAGSPAVKSKRTEYGVDLVYQILPARTANPFLSAGLSNVMLDTIVEGKPTFADEDLKYKVGTGAEMRLARDVSLNIAVAYQGSFHASYDSDVTAGVSLNGWLTDLLLIGVGVDGSFDTGDTTATVRISYGF